MAQRMRIHLISIFILLATTFFLAVVLVRSAEAGRGIVLRPPFNGICRVTSYFDHETPSYGTNGYTWIYNGERTATGSPYPYDGHDGWDFSMITGTYVLAGAAGTVVVADWGDWGNGFGRTIIIDHGNSYYTQYSHLSNLLVGLGNPVTPGQYIADSGNTGHSDGPHLHFGVRQGGYANTTYAIDPFGWRGNRRDPLYNYKCGGVAWQFLGSRPRVL